MDSANGFSGKLEKNTTWYYEENPDVSYCKHILNVNIFIESNTLR